MISLSTGFKNNLLNTIGYRTLLGGGAIHLFDGTQPNHADQPPNGQRLGVITNGGAIESFPSNGLYFEVPTSGILMKKLSQVWQVRVLQAGTATWFRFVSWRNEYAGFSTNAIRLDGEIGSELILVNPTLSVSEPTIIQSFYLHL